jgi:5-methylcytosine-specific restriction protein A
MAARDKQRGSSTARGYGSVWRATAATVLAQHRAVYGNWCTGYGVPAHGSADLTVDHIIPKAKGGSSTKDNLRVLCRSCNARKRDRPA